MDLHISKPVSSEFEILMSSVLTIAGGGIVFDSDPYDEYIETINKLAANTQTILSAEKMYAGMQSNGNE
jgi:hypothetical protein